MDFQKHTLAFASWLIVAIVAQFVVTDPRLRAAEDTLMAVAAASAAWDEAFNAGELKRLMARYQEDAVSMPPGAPALLGRKAIDADFKGFFEGNVVEHHTVNATRHAAGDTVVERAEYTLTIRPKDGSAPAQEEGKHIVVHARQADGSWKVMWEIWNAAR